MPGRHACEFTPKIAQAPLSAQPKAPPDNTDINHSPTANHSRNCGLHATTCATVACGAAGIQIKGGLKGKPFISKLTITDFGCRNPPE